MSVFRLARRAADPNDQRRMLLGRTERASDTLEKLSAAHLEERARIKPSLKEISS